MSEGNVRFTPLHCDDLLTLFLCLVHVRVDAVFDYTFGSVNFSSLISLRVPAGEMPLSIFS